jgi:hypothetical protein
MELNKSYKKNKQIFKTNEKDIYDIIYKSLSKKELKAINNFYNEKFEMENLNDCILNNNNLFKRKLK